MLASAIYLLSRLGLTIEIEFTLIVKESNSRIQISGPKDDYVQDKFIIREKEVKHNKQISK